MNHTGRRVGLRDLVIKETRALKSQEKPNSSYKVSINNMKSSPNDNKIQSKANIIKCFDYYKSEIEIIALQKLNIYTLYLALYLSIHDMESKNRECPGPLTGATYYHAQHLYFHTNIVQSKSLIFDGCFDILGD